MISPIHMAASAALGAFIGYFTNALAIKALFRPLRPRWYSLGWQGVIPKNRARLADNVARVVGEDLLYRDYLLEQIERPALQENLRAYLQGWGQRFLEARPDEVFARLPAPWREQGLENMLARGLALLADWSDGEGGRAVAGKLARELVEVFRAQSLGEVLEEAQAEKLVAMVGEALVDERLRSRAQEVLQREIEGFLGSDKPLAEVLPTELGGLLRERLRDEVPVLLERLARWLSERDHVEHLSERILTALETYAEGENSLRSLVGGLSLRLFRDSIRDAVNERLPQVARAYLESAETRARVEDRLVEGVDAILARPLGQLLGQERQVVAARIAGVASTWATSAEARERLQEVLREQYAQRRAQPLADIVPETGWRGLEAACAAMLCDVGRKAPEWTPRLAAALRSGVQVADRSLRDYIGLDAARERRFLDWSQERVSAVLRREVPVLLEQVDITELVRERVMTYDLLRVEGLVKNIIHDQLRYINLLGALMGGVVGLLLPFINSYLP
jgi:uncharacterized membrane protein YheB (UPF0754 family)